MESDELCYVVAIVKRIGYLKFIEIVQNKLTAERDFLINECNTFAVEQNIEKKQENIQRKIYKFKRIQKHADEDKKAENTMVDAVKESELKVLSVPEIHKVSNTNIVEILKSDSVELNTNEIVTIENKKKCSGEELKKIRKGLAIRKFYKK